MLFFDRVSSSGEGPAFSKTGSGLELTPPATVGPEGSLDSLMGGAVVASSEFFSAPSSPKAALQQPMVRASADTTSVPVGSAGSLQRSAPNKEEDGKELNERREGYGSL